MGCVNSVEDGESFVPINKINRSVTANASSFSVNETEVDISHFSFSDRVLGVGGFGVVRLVFKVCDPKKGEPFALKSMSKSQVLKRSSGCTAVMTELKALSLLQNNNFICAPRFAFQDNRFLYLVLDLVAGGDMRCNIRKQENFRYSEERARFYICQIMLAVAACHKVNVLHRDVKPENLLLGGDGYLRLTDFGVAKVLPNDIEDCRSTSGTHGYMAPEIYFPTHRHGPAADWFAVGVTLHELVSGRRPFDGARLQSLRTKRDDPLYPSELFDFPFISVQCKDLIAHLLYPQPAKRLGYGDGLSAIEKHPWLHSVDWKALSSRTIEPEYRPKADHILANSELNSEDVKASILKHTQEPEPSEEEQKLFNGYALHNRISSPSVATITRDFDFNDNSRYMHVNGNNNNNTRSDSTSNNNVCFVHTSSPSRSFSNSDNKESAVAFNGNYHCKDGVHSSSKPSISTRKQTASSRRCSASNVTIGTSGSGSKPTTSYTHTPLCKRPKIQAVVMSSSQPHHYGSGFATEKDGLAGLMMRYETNKTPARVNSTSGNLSYERALIERACNQRVFNLSSTGFGPTSSSEFGPSSQPSMPRHSQQICYPGASSCPDYNLNFHVDKKGDEEFDSNKENEVDFRSHFTQSPSPAVKPTEVVILHQQLNNNNNNNSRSALASAPTPPRLLYRQKNAPCDPNKISLECQSPLFIETRSRGNENMSKCDADKTTRMDMSLIKNNNNNNNKSEQCTADAPGKLQPSLPSAQKSHTIWRSFPFNNNNNNSKASRYRMDRQSAGSAVHALEPPSTCNNNNNNNNNNNLSNFVPRMSLLDTGVCAYDTVESDGVAIALGKGSAHGITRGPGPEVLLWAHHMMSSASVGTSSHSASVHEEMSSPFAIAPSPFPPPSLANNNSNNNNNSYSYSERASFQEGHVG